ncbi:MAG TPA: GatB/YqeY domain-containing protein [Candidatus Binataceae bacterium]|nr:GatB/YqeY domain-containing protein [Candidatus Binataceae bacterium]
MKQKLRDELTAAMKSGDKTRTMVLRGVLAEISRYEVEKDIRREADEAAVVQILKREKARREETLEFARKGNRQDLVEQNEAELKIIEGYLPAGVSEDELRATVKEAIASGAGQIGALMKTLRDKFGARLDVKLASDIVKQELAKK